MARMAKKSDRTFQVYLRAGAAMRLYRDVSGKLIDSLNPILRSSYIDRLIRMTQKVEEICSIAEDKMFADFPDLSDTHVFYGTTHMDPQNWTFMDSQVIDLSLAIAKECFCCSDEHFNSNVAGTYGDGLEEGWNSAIEFLNHLTEKERKEISALYRDDGIDGVYGMSPDEIKDIVFRLEKRSDDNLRKMPGYKDMGYIYR